MTKPIQEYPTPVIDGFLEVTIGAMHSGMELGDPVRNILDDMQRREMLLAKRLERRADKQQVIPGERLGIAYNNLGKIAAINTLLARPDKTNITGFTS